MSLNFGLGDKNKWHSASCNHAFGRELKYLSNQNNGCSFGFACVFNHVISTGSNTFLKSFKPPVFALEYLSSNLKDILHNFKCFYTTFCKRPSLNMGLKSPVQSSQSDRFPRTPHEIPTIITRPHITCSIEL